MVKADELQTVSERKISGLKLYQYSAAWDSKHKVAPEEGKSARVLFDIQQVERFIIWCYIIS